MPRRKWPRLLHQPGRPRTGQLSWHKLDVVYGKFAERLGCPDGTHCDLTPAPGRTYIRATYPPSGRGRGESLTSPRRIEAKLRAVKVIRLRAAGYTFAAIARALGFADGSGAYRAYKRTIDRIDWNQQRTEELRRSKRA